MAGHKPWSEIRAKAEPEVLAGAAALTTSRRLSGLAAARGLTTDEVADRLHARWETFPPVTSPRDVVATTLYEVVEAMGGNLEIRAIFSGRGVPDRRRGPPHRRAGGSQERWG